MKKEDFRNSRREIMKLLAKRGKIETERRKLEKMRKLAIKAEKAFERKKREKEEQMAKKLPTKQKVLLDYLQSKDPLGYSKLPPLLIYADAFQE